MLGVPWGVGLRAILTREGNQGSAFQGYQFFDVNASIGSFADGTRYIRCRTRSYHSHLMVQSRCNEGADSACCGICAHTRRDTARHGVQGRGRVAG